MAVYRYSAQGIERLVRRMRRQALLITGIAMAAGVILSALEGAGSLPLVAIAISVPGALVYWSLRRAGASAEGRLRSAEFYIDGEELTAQSSLASATIRRDEVTQVRTVRVGTVVRGKDLWHMVHLRPELENYGELLREINAWVPPYVPRLGGSTEPGRWIAPLLLLNLGLLAAAFGAQSPAVAVPCCIVEALLLISLVVIVWKSGNVAPRLRWQVSLCVFPVCGLLMCAYLLMTRP